MIRRGESRTKLWKSTIFYTTPVERFEQCSLSKLSAEDFLKFLEQKVSNVTFEQALMQNARPEESVPVEASFTGFRIVLADDVRRIIIMASQRSRVHLT